MAPSVHAVWHGPLLAAAHDWPRDQQQCVPRQLVESDVRSNNVPFSVVRRCQVIRQFTAVLGFGQRNTAMTIALAVMGIVHLVAARVLRPRY